MVVKIHPNGVITRKKTKSRKRKVNRKQRELRMETRKLKKMTRNTTYKDYAVFKGARVMGQRPKFEEYVPNDTVEVFERGTVKPGYDSRCHPAIKRG